MQTREKLMEPGARSNFATPVRIAAAAAIAVCRLTFWCLVAQAVVGLGIAAYYYVTF